MLIGDQMMSMTDSALIVCANGTSCAISINFTSATYKTQLASEIAGKGYLD
jgi:hypothetical protein